MWTFKETLAIVASAPILSILCCCICTGNLIDGNWRHPFYAEGYCGTNRRPKKEWMREEAEERKWSSSKPKPLPPRRSRRLTLPLDESRCKLPMIAKKKQRIYSQSQSLFFSRLPIEIRELIYHEVIVGGTPNFRILRKKYHPRLGHIRYTQQPDKVIFDDTQWGHTGAHRSRCKCCLKWMTYGGLLALLLTCRRLYSEAIRLLYQGTIFELKNPMTLLAWRQTILPQRLNMINALHLTWQVRAVRAPTKRVKSEWAAWHQCCRVLSEMRDLRRLTVVIDHAYDTGLVTRAEVEGYLQPLYRIRHVQDFVVGLFWECNVAEYLDDRASFRLMQKAHAPSLPE